jgi:membrane protein implicated in regulation of membrane protease activity
MADTTFWWLAAGILVAAELLTGTFYLLMLACGLAAAALAAHLGLGSTLQMTAAAVVGGGAVLIWHLLRRRRAARQRATADHDVNLDIGATVQVQGWEADGSARVRHRGALWSARPAPGSPVGVSGAHRIVEVQGNQLVIEKIPS